MRLALTALACPLAFLLAVAPAAAQDYPKLKSGLWEMSSRSSTQGPADPPLKTTMCLDEATSKEMYNASQGVMAGICSKFDIKKSGNVYSSEATCQIGPSKMVAKSTMTLVGDSSYTIQHISTYDPPFMGMKDASTSVEAKHAGACKPGMQPGDITTAAGQTINIKNLQQPAAPKK